jgi:hypothetical protein
MTSEELFVLVMALTMVCPAQLQLLQYRWAKPSHGSGLKSAVLFGNFVDLGMKKDYGSITLQ